VNRAERQKAPVAAPNSTSKSLRNQGTGRRHQDGDNRQQPHIIEQMHARVAQVGAAASEFVHFCHRPRHGAVRARGAGGCAQWDLGGRSPPRLSKVLCRGRFFAPLLGRPAE